MATLKSQLQICCDQQFFEHEFHVINLDASHLMQYAISANFSFIVQLTDL